ncbi:hypothetical protein [Streptomyces cellostaticus]|uniref:hypothetical protein n=1 Tax=Streptomyces cellostaticus TaxID=67285 RepID=UPI000A464FCA|nr:hypothetical protein [Streptomyces cellostaticus]GHI10091.1 hypothetical protein Scel_84120 [Streptomyces cellostaticus]
MSVARKRGHLLSAIAFLTWTSETGIDINAVPQQNADDWLDADGPSRRSIRRFRQ